MRANLVFAVGVAGDREEIERFMELMRMDFGRRCEKAATQIFAGRIQILQLPEVEDAPEDQSDAGTGGEGIQGEDRGEGGSLHAVGREPSSEEDEPQDEPGPEQA